LSPGVVPWLRRNAYLAVAAAALLVLTRTVEFSPPDQVRTSPALTAPPAAEMVGGALADPSQTKAGTTTEPRALAAEAVQMRATLRQYTDLTLEPGASIPDDNNLGEVLSEPVVTTVIGVEAEIRQTIRLGDDLDIDLGIVFTPRQGIVKKGVPASLTLDHAISVHSRSRSGGWGETAVTRRVHLDTRGVLHDMVSTGYPLVFAVDEHLFRLELELHRGVQ